MKIPIITLWIIILAAAGVNAQQFPQDFNYSAFSEILLDAGLQWKLNSAFHPFKIRDFEDPDDNSYKSFAWMNDYLLEHSESVTSMQKGSADGIGAILIPGVGVSKAEGDGASYEDAAFYPFFWSELEFKSRFYARVYFRGTNEPESLPHFSAAGKNKERAGLSHGEIDQALLGFRNDWLNIEYGRTREIWGPFTGDNLLLAGNSPPYERMMGQVTYKRFTGRWFFGSLNSAEGEFGENINRYLSGRILEYNNRKNLVVSAGELSLFSGPDRPIDLGLLNPLAFHIEIEQNDRENDVTGNHSNAILFFNVDYLFKPNLRLTGSFIIDDLQIDFKNREEGDSDALGYVARFAWTPLYEPVGLTVFGYGSRIDTYSLIHAYGYNNLVNREEPVGSPMGNDADDYGLGVRCLLPYKSAVELSAGQKRWGDYSLLLNPYVSYPHASDVPFPSGELRENSYIEVRIFAYPYQNVLINAGAHFDLDHSGEGSEMENYYLSISYQIPIVLINL